MGTPQLRPGSLRKDQRSSHIRSSSLSAAVLSLEEQYKVSPMSRATLVSQNGELGETALRGLADTSVELSDSERRNRADSSNLEEIIMSLDLNRATGLDFGQDVPIMSSQFNVLLIRDQVTLKVVVSRVFSTMVDPAVQVPMNILKEYIHEVSVHYRPNPFHNFHHAVNVLHFLAVVLDCINGSKLFSELNIFALLLSALVHDVDHPGKTNLFEINSASALALLYNDMSVLENHHCSMSFRLMQKPGTNVLARLPLEQKKEVRKFLIACVLATDMSKHSDLIEEAKNKSLLKGTLLEPPDQAFFGKLFLHSADLSGPAKEFSVAREWASRVTEEFNEQVVVETDMGLPVLSFMAAADEKTFLKNEIGFSGFFVAPLWRIVSKLCPQLEFVHKQLESNINRYKYLKEEKEKGEYAMHALS